MNTSNTPAEPTFKRGANFPAPLARRSGGGDWNNDGIEDVAAVMARAAQTWSVYLGESRSDGKHIFKVDPALTISRKKGYEFIGNEMYPPWRNTKPDLLGYTPYAWNFSGKLKQGSGISEVVVARFDPMNRTKKKSGTGGFMDYIDYYEINHNSKKIRFKGTLAYVPNYRTRLSIGDLNADGRMDIVYAGDGVNKNTKIWVMYGKVKNIPEQATCRKLFESATE